MSEITFREGETTKEPLVSYCPRVRATIGPLVEEWRCERNCVWPNHIFKQRALVEVFEILFQGVTIKFDLRDGAVWLCPSGASPEVQHKSDLPLGTKFRLIWFRRMGGHIHEWDKSSKPPELFFYGVGWQATVGGKNFKFGYTIDPDGNFAPNLPLDSPV